MYTVQHSVVLSCQAVISKFRTLPFALTYDKVPHDVVPHDVAVDIICTQYSILWYCHVKLNYSLK